MISFSTAYIVAVFVAWEVWFSAKRSPRAKLIVCWFMVGVVGLFSGVGAMTFANFTDGRYMTAAMFNLGIGLYFAIHIPSQRAAVRAAKENLGDYIVNI